MDNILEWINQYVKDFPILFMESNEHVGLLYNRYKFIPNEIDLFMNLLDHQILKLKKGEEVGCVEIRETLERFNNTCKINVNNPDLIDIPDVKYMRQILVDFRKNVNRLFNRYYKQRDRATPSTGLKGILSRPKIHSMHDEESYIRINNEIRIINRSLDWIEKVLFDLLNLVNQDINVLSVIQKVYFSEKYEWDNKDDDEDPNWMERYLREDGGNIEDPPELNEENEEDINDKDESDIEKEKQQEQKPVEKLPERKSYPKQTDEAESNKNGVRRKKLYIAFIEWCKEYNPKNTFGSVFDKDAFSTYPFVPQEMRYFYRLANPLLCVLAGGLTFFALSELRNLNKNNSRMQELFIFAATEDKVRVFNNTDKKIYIGTEEKGILKLGEMVGNSFDLYIQKMIGCGEILNGPIENE
jgi:hypothetical protein